MNLVAAAGVANVITVSITGNLATITDSADVINESVIECSGGGTNTVQCTMPFQIVRSDIDAGDLSDSIRAQSTGTVILYGGDGDDELTAISTPTAPTNLHGDDADGNPAGDGNDTLTGGDSFDFLDGGGGTDTLRGNGGDDALVPGTGDGERAEGGPGDDSFSVRSGHGSGETLDGGDGVDTLSATGPDTGSVFTTPIAADLTAGTVSVAGAGSTATGFEHAFVGSGVGALTGSDGPNRLSTGNGDDVVDPRAGADFVNVSAGADRVFTRDGFPDRVSCGPGADRVEADQLDELFDCEDAPREFVLPAGVDQDPPGCTVTRLRRKLSRRRFLRGVTPRVSCDEPAALRARLTVAVRARRGRGRMAGAGELVLAERSLAFGEGSRRVVLRIPRRLRTVLGRRFKARLTIVARDEFGNRTRISRLVTVR